MRVLGFARFAFAALALVAVATDLIHGLRVNDLKLANFFSYFTIQSNIIGALVLLIAGFAALRGSQSRELSGLRGAGTLYLVITGVVYNLLLADTAGALTQLVWTNTVLHMIMPAAVLLDFLADRTVHPLGLRNALWWLAYPLLWTAYTMIRGGITDWYPYPFLEVPQHGWGSVLLYILGISATFFVVGTVLAYSTRVLNRSQPKPVAPAPNPQALA